MTQIFSVQTVKKFVQSVGNKSQRSNKTAHKVTIFFGIIKDKTKYSYTNEKKVIPLPLQNLINSPCLKSAGFTGLLHHESVMGK